MIKQKQNVERIVETWKPRILSVCKNLNESSDRLEWMSVYANNHLMAINEDIQVYNSNGLAYNNLYNTMGIGDPQMARMSALTAGEQSGGDNVSSADKWPAVFPISLQVAGKTIAFDLINTTPFDGPDGAIPFLDYVYSNSKQPGGAAPYAQTGRLNPDFAAHGLNEGKQFTANQADADHYGFSDQFSQNGIYPMPAAFQVTLVKDEEGTPLSRTEKKAIIEQLEATHAVAGADAYVTFGGELTAEYVGVSRINGYPIFKPVPTTAAMANRSLLSFFDGNLLASMEIPAGEEAEEEEVEDASEGDASTGTGEDASKGDASTGTGEEESSASCYALRPRLVSMLENHILGYAGAGKYDTDKWSATWMDAQHIYDPMSRGTGETQYARQLSLEFFVKYVHVGTQQIAVTCTLDQVTDLNKQWGINVMNLLENAAVNELTQTLNKQILSRLWALGWLNHMKAFDSEGINLNMALGFSAEELEGATTPKFAYYDEFGVHEGNDGGDMDIVIAPDYGHFVNRDVELKRLFTQVLYAGNVITQRGRRGPANFIVTNLKLATALQTNAQYGFSPFANTINQTNGQLYPVGTIAGMTVYVDPNMKFEDTRVLVGRKGEKDEPGLHFCPYLIADKISGVSEGNNFQPKMIIRSRYNLVDVGWYPESQYLTFFVKTPAGVL